MQQFNSVRRVSAIYDVCVITTIHGDFDNRIYHRQLDAFVNAGMSVCIVAPWNFARRGRDDFDFVQTRMPKNRLARVRHAFETYIVAKRIQAKTYVFHDPDFLLLAWFLKLGKGRPVIYDCHENVPEEILYGKEWIPGRARVLTSMIVRRIENFIVRQLGETVVVVPHLKRRFECLGSRAVLVRNFANFKMPEKCMNEFAVLYTGELTRDYGLEHLVELARELKRRGVSTPMRIVDRFHERDDLRKWFVSTIRDEQLHVEILDSVIAEEMPSILTKGCVGLNLRTNLPQHALAYPTKVFEYFMFGLAVLSTDVAGSREILENGRLGMLVPSGDIVGLADALEILLVDPKLRKHYVDAGRAALTEKYNWSHDRDKLVAYVQAVQADQHFL